MKTTKPRKLVQYMNTHIARWKLKTELVQKAIDALPPVSKDQTADMPSGDKRSRTDTDNMSQFDEENKDEANPWVDQEPANMNNPTMISEKTIPQGSKAGTTTIPTPEPQEISPLPVINPDP